MENLLENLGIQKDSALALWTGAVVILVILMMAGTFLHRMVMNQVRRLTEKTAGTWDDEIVAAISTPTYLMLLAAAVKVSVEASALPLKENMLFDNIVRGAFILFAFWGIERAFYALIRSGIVLRNLTSSSRTLVATILRVAIIVLGVLMVLDSSGVSITPLLASLGVGSVAVALALQDTLSNLFSGFYILADRPFSVGDYVKLESGVEGFVVKIGWRSTHIRQYSNNVNVVPNSTVVNSTLTNFDMQDKETAAYIRCGVSYDTDLKKAEEIIFNIGKEVIDRVDGAVKSYEPRVRWKEFGDSSINFLVILRAKTYDEHFFLTHEFIKALHAGLEKEGIEIPFPQRVVHMKSDT